MLTRRQLIKLGLGGVATAAVLRGYHTLRLTEEPPVIIVGAGAAGLIAAYELLERNIPVTMFSTGGKATSETTEPIHEEDPRQGVTFPSDAPFFWWVRVNHVGGRVNLWGGHTPRYSAADFEDLGRDYPGLTWPIPYQEMVAAYDRVEPLLAIAGIPEGIKDAPDNQFLTQVAPTLFLNEIKNMGRSIGVPATAARYSSFKPIDFIDSLLKHPRFSLIPNAQVRRIEIDPATNRPQAVVFQTTANSAEVSLRARHVILAASTLSSTKILQASSCPRYPDGLGNASGVLGRYLNDHAFTMGTFIKKFSNSNEAREIGGYFIPRIDRAFPEIESDGFGSMQMQLNVTKVFGDQCQGKFFVFANTCPSAESRSTLLPDNETLQIDYRTSSNTKHLHSRMKQVTEAFLQNATLQFDFPPAGRAVHEVGTCRMGTDPRTSMVDSYGRLHEIPEIVVVDGGIFPSQSEKNTTLTLMALSSRATRKLVTTL